MLELAPRGVTSNTWRGRGRGRGRRALGAAAALLMATSVVAACNGAAPATVPPTATTGATATPSPTATPPPTPAPTAVPTPTPTPIPLTAGDLAAGTYRVSSSPAVVFTVDGGWTATIPEPNTFDLEKGPTYIFVGVVTQVFTACCEDQETVPVPDGADPAAMAAEMARNAGLHLTAAQPISIGGATGVVFDVTTDADTNYGFIAGDHQGYAFGKAIKVRLALLSVAGTLVAITVEGAVDQFDAVVAQAQPVLESLRFS